MNDDLDLGALLCSRLCHDLISPVGAVGNGLELLDPDGGADAEVRALLGDSARAASAALAFYRIAFGAVGAPGAEVSTQELGDLARGYFAAGRHTLAWPAHGDPLPRPAAKVLLLMLLAAATATPIGGALTVGAPRAAPLDLCVIATGRRAGLSAETHALLTGADRRLPEAPRDAHLALIARMAPRMGLRIGVSQSAETVTIEARAG